jgi:adenosylcobinamide-GDP ribazoletransferase
VREKVSQEGALLIVAVQFLTRIPVPSPQHYSPASFERALRYLPLVGGLVGIFCAGVFLMASALWNGPIAALLAVACGIAVTGALHEDGFADFFDGLGGSTREARLAIMKDSRIGTYGVLALGIGVSLKVLALGSLSPWTAAGALVAAHAGGRLAAVFMIWRLPYGGSVALAKIPPVEGQRDAVSLAIAAGCGLAPCLLLSLSGLAGLFAGAASAAAVGFLAMRLLGGYTGDVLGAAEQIFEIAFLLSIAACA